MRFWLNVPFAEKEDAKKMGARWDAEKKMWFAPDGANTVHFEKWAMRRPKFNIKADFFFIAETSGSCWMCSKNTKFITVGVNHGFLSDVAINEEFWDLDEDELQDHEKFQSLLHFNRKYARQ